MLRNKPTSAKKTGITSEASYTSPYTYLIMFYSKYSYWYNVERFFSLFRIIAEKGVDVNQTGKHGMTPAHYATEYVANANRSRDIIDCLYQ
ncbi:MAG: hypothetical protein AB2693_32305, partial [Candidatus Thiodiazotropha sp.]